MFADTMSAPADADATDRVALNVDARGTLRGRAAPGMLPPAVTILYNGARWARVPCFDRDGAPGRRFSCDLPVLDMPEDAEIAVLGEEDTMLARLVIRGRVPVRSGHGVKASEIMALCDRPFYGIPYISFDGSRITVVGSHLPPDGDPSALGVSFGPGVAYSFNHPLASTGWEGHFWYWPNARLSDFQLVIDLSASLSGSDPFHFRFTYPESLTRDFPPPYGEVWLPRDLGAYVGFPVDPTQLTRVQCWTDKLSVTMTGYNAFRTIESLLARYGIGAQGTRLMDWGCGHGRVCRHFIREWPEASIIGMDIDAENVAWASAHLPGGRFVASPLLPPCELQDGCLDALFSISVMTHLTAAVQRAWLAELARLIRPGGIALMSFGGPAAVAWASVWHPAAYIEKWQRRGIHDDLIDPALDGKIADATYYRNTAQSHAQVRATWQEHFEVLDILPEALGNLDFAVLRRR